MQNAVPKLKHGMLQLSAVALAITALIGCGGSGSDSSGGNIIEPPVSQCSATGEKQQFIDYMYDDYFWASDLPSSVDAADYEDVYEVLEALRVPEDRFSFLLTEEEYESRYVNASFAGFGFSSELVDGNRVFLRYVYDDSPAAQAGLGRADELLAIDGESVASLLASGAYNDALGPGQVGIQRELTWRKPNGDELTALVTKDNVDTNTVFAPTVLETNGQRVGYFVLDSFINRTGADLNDAYNLLAAEGVDELVIDVRYNGGGLIRYANQISSQAAGNNVLGEVFITYNFNEQNQNRNETELFNLGEGIEQLDLARVFVLTTGASCSSSEIIINSLEPFVEVVVIGEPTCGKPVGQSVQQLCDKYTFVVNFETVNANGNGQYFNGLQPDCPIADRIVADWADPADPLTGAALDYVANGACPAVADIPSQTPAAARAETRTALPVLLEKWRSEH